MFDKETFFSMIRDGIPGLYLFEGHPANDTIIKPMDLLRESIGYDIEEIKTFLGLSPEMPQERLDAIASNYRITRSSGSYAVGAVTIAVQLPTEFNPSGITFSTEEGLVFRPTRLTPIKESDYSSVESYYTVRLSVVSVEKGIDYNVPIGAVTSADGLSFTPLFISNESRYSGGSDEQSNDSMITAIENSITDRSLTRKSGIIVSLSELYPELSWFKVVGSGELEMTRDVRVIDNMKVSLGYAADIYVYPAEGYIDGSQVLEIGNGINANVIVGAPAIGPYSIQDSNGDISSIYWDILVKDSGNCNSLKENKVVSFKTPKNRFDASVLSSDYTAYGIENGDIFHSDDADNNVIGVSSDGRSIYIDKSKDGTQVEARTYTVIYPLNNEWSDAPYIKYDTSLAAYILKDTGSVTDFSSIITDPDPNLKLYMVEVEDVEGNVHFHDIDAVITSYLQLETLGEYNYSPKRYRIIQSNPMESLFSLKVESWIDPWHYFRASIVSPTGGILRMTDDLILPIVSKVELGEVYIEIAGGYYKITGIEYEGQTLYVSIKYESSEQNEAVLLSQPVYSLSGTGNFIETSNISDVASGSVSVYYRTYPLDLIQGHMDGDDDRIITTDYLAKIPYEAEVIVNIRYKGDVSEGELAAAIIDHVGSIEPIGGSNKSVKLLQASDIIDVCYGKGVNYIDLSTYSVYVRTNIPSSNSKWSPLLETEYRIYAEDTIKNYVFKYFSTPDDITITKIL